MSFRFNIKGFSDKKHGKSILPSYKFSAEFIGITNAIQPYHVRSVSYEQHTFKHEGQYHGPGILDTFPVLDRAENGGYKLTVVLEEDAFLTVFNFIESLKRLIIAQNGIYMALTPIQLQMKIFTSPVQRLLFSGVYFQSAEGSEWSYGSSDQKTYTLNLVYENYQTSFDSNEDDNVKPYWDSVPPSDLNSDDNADPHWDPVPLTRKQKDELKRKLLENNNLTTPPPQNINGIDTQMV